MLNLSQVQATTQDVLPAGKYAAIVTGATIKDTKTGGQMIAAEFTVTTDGQKGRKIWENYNIKNDNAKATEIGLSQLKTLAMALGYTAEQLANFHPEMLLNKELILETKVEMDATYGDKARVRKYLKKPAAGQFETTADSVPF